MALRNIVKVGDPVLTKKCRPVTKFDDSLATLLDDMFETMHDANGVGLAGPQVGLLRRVVVIDTGEELVELINPKIVETSGEQEDVEGCLSVPGEYWLVKRPSFARVCATDRDGNEFELSGEGLTARCICHECDHLDGHIYTEIASRRLTDEELEEMRKESKA